MVAIRHERVWNQQASSVTTAFTDTEYVLHPTIGLVLTGFVGTVNIQGRHSPDHAWQTVRLVKLYGEFEPAGVGLTTITTGRLAFAGESRSYYYKLADSWPMLQAELVRSAGNVTLDWWAHEADNFMPGIVRLSLEGMEPVPVKSDGIESLLKAIAEDMRLLRLGQEVAIGERERYA